MNDWTWQLGSIVTDARGRRYKCVITRANPGEWPAIYFGDINDKDDHRPYQAHDRLDRRWIGLRLDEMQGEGFPRNIEGQRLRALIPIKDPEYLKDHPEWGEVAL